MAHRAPFFLGVLGWALATAGRATANDGDTGGWTRRWFAFLPGVSVAVVIGPNYRLPPSSTSGPVNCS